MTTETPQPIDTKFETRDYVRETTPFAKLRSSRRPMHSSNSLDILVFLDAGCINVEGRVGAFEWRLVCTSY